MCTVSVHFSPFKKSYKNLKIINNNIIAHYAIHNKISEEGKVSLYHTKHACRINTLCMKIVVRLSFYLIFCGHN